MQKKKGFTLIEVLVVILVTTLVFSMVAGAMFFISKTTSNYIQQSQEIDTAKNIENYLRTFKQQTVTLEDWQSLINLQDNGDIINSDTVLFSDTGLITLNIYQVDNSFIKCYMKYQSGREFEFIIDIIR